ncbi:MAG: endonuclease/exonuclease/phosphatase family protein [Prevotellaceae bacterium]|jgi:endonuclease/exonuclease/phosphatase family metal-dependent hydrolase|nr:endonuclease/exonuclease/phosphatase family protein [Prevotellaceae bacterium]
MLLAASVFAQAQGVTCTPGRIAFTESVAVGDVSPPQSFTATVSNLSDSVTVQPGSQVQVSLTNSGYSRNPLTIAADELAEGKEMYVRFAPVCSGFSDSVITSSIIFLNQRSELLGSVTVSGIAQPESATGALLFKVATFNAEWLGCPENGPSDESLQMLNVATLISQMDADVVALQEVTNSPTKSIDTVLKRLGSAWGGYIVPYSPSRCAQSEAIIYKKNRMSLIATPRLMSNAGANNAWSNGRYPVEFTLDLGSGSRSVPITLVNLHAKAFDDAESYERRGEAAQGLKALLDGSGYNAKSIIVLGDYNDDIDESTYNKQLSPYKNFADDSLSYRFLSSQISESVSLIDHIMVSNELFSFYVPGSAQLETAATGSIPDYKATTSDHTPVSVAFAFGREGQAIPIPDCYTVYLNEDRSFELPALGQDDRPLRYAIDSGAVALLSERTLTLSDTGTVRMLAWQSGDASVAPAAKFFYVQATDRRVAPKIIAQPVGREVKSREAAVFAVQATGTRLSYQWKKDGKSIAGATSFRYAIVRAGNSHIGYYSCVVSNDMGVEESQAARLCVNTMCPTTAVHKNTFENRLKIYPNPARQSFSVESAAGSMASLRVCSVSGEVVYERQNLRASTLSIPTSGWSAGIYVLTVTSERGEKAVGKILIVASNF